MDNTHYQHLESAKNGAGVPQIMLVDFLQNPRTTDYPLAQLAPGLAWIRTDTGQMKFSPDGVKIITLNNGWIVAKDGDTLEWGNWYIVDPAHDYSYETVTENFGSNWLKLMPTADWNTFTGIWTTQGTDTVADQQTNLSLGDQPLTLVGRLDQYTAGVNNIELRGVTVTNGAGGDASDRVLKAGDIMTGDLTISRDPAVRLNLDSNDANAHVYFRENGKIGSIVYNAKDTALVLRRYNIAGDAVVAEMQFSVDGYIQSKHEHRVVTPVVGTSHQNAAVNLAFLENLNIHFPDLFKYLPLAGGTLVGNLSIIQAAGAAHLALDSAATQSAHLWFQEGTAHRGLLIYDAFVDRMVLRKYDRADGSTIQSQLHLFADRLESTMEHLGVATTAASDDLSFITKQWAIDTFGGGAGGDFMSDGSVDMSGDLTIAKADASIFLNSDAATDSKIQLEIAGVARALLENIEGDAFSIQKMNAAGNAVATEIRLLESGGVDILTPLTVAGDANVTGQVTAFGANSAARIKATTLGTGNTAGVSLNHDAVESMLLYSQKSDDTLRLRKFAVADGSQQTELLFNADGSIASSGKVTVVSSAYTTKDDVQGTLTTKSYIDERNYARDFISADVNNATQTYAKALDETFNISLAGKYEISWSYEWGTDAAATIAHIFVNGPDGQVSEHVDMIPDSGTATKLKRHNSGRAIIDVTTSGAKNFNIDFRVHNGGPAGVVSLYRPKIVVKWFSEL